MKIFPFVFLLLYLNSIITSSAQGQGSSAAEAFPQTHTVSSKYMGSMEIGLLYGKIENPFNNPPTYLASPSVLMFNGFRQHRLFVIGITTGFDFYENILITPIALGFRGELFNTRVSPYYSIDMGYGATFLSGKGFEEKRPEGGFLLNPVLGLRVNTGNQTAFLFGLGYKRQRVDWESVSLWGVRMDQRITYNRLSIRMGFMF
jgi:hypothetical protein